MVLLVVDVQKGIVDERLYAFEKFVSNIRKLIETAREHGVEVCYIQHDDGPGTGFSIGDDAFEVYSEFQPMPAEKRFVKTVSSAFKKESGLLEYLTAKGEKDVMVCGIMTDFCINATVEAGFEHGLHMIVPAYAQMGRRELNKHCQMEAAAEKLLAKFFTALGLSARSHDRIIKVARTIADLDGSDIITAAHLAEAVQLRTSLNS